MRKIAILGLCGLLAGFSLTALARADTPAPAHEIARAEACPTDPLASATTRRAYIDTRGGPDPNTTPRILDILDQHCIKATFFMVGIYAKARPDLVREVARRGHIIGTHTNTHPNNLRHLSLTRAKSEITKGFDAVRGALAGAPASERAALAPFFRFPGLNDKKSLITWLGNQDIATMSCSFGADDWKRINANSVYKRGLAAIESEGRGILILHDTKPHTADMLSRFIVTLEKRGYSFVQLAPKPQHHNLAETSSDMRTSLP